MMSALELSALLNGKKSGSGYVARCPAHDDKNPSLSITDGDESVVLVHCHAGCTQGAVIESLRRIGVSLFPQRSERSDFKTVKEYIYQNDSGEDCLKVVRLERFLNGNREKKFFQEHKEGQEWIKGGTTCVPYRYSRWKDQEIVILVEGEKCAEFLEEGGLFATTTPGGAKSWKDRYASYFTGKDVYIIPDNDAPGQKYAQSAFNNLKSVCKAVKIIMLPDLLAGEDVVEWFEKGNSNDNLLDLFKASSSEQNDWDEIVPMDDYAVPSISESLFPSELSEFVLSVSKATETPIELAMMLTLGALSRAAMGKFQVETEPRFFEWTVLYIMCALPSGNRKTSVLKMVTAPLEIWERQKIESLFVQIQEAQTKRKNEEAILKKLRNRLGGKNENNIELSQRIYEAEAQLTMIPHIPRLFANDITPERLATLMSEQEERIGLFSDEGGMFDNFGGRYSNGLPNLDLFLKSYDGSPVRVDRQSGAPVHLHQPLITTAICPQPSVIAALAKKPEFRGRGLVARFLFAIPKSPLGYRSGEVVPVDARVLSNYENIIYSILNYELPKEDPKNPIKLRLSKIAYDLWKDNWRMTESKLRADGEFELMSDWGSKLPGATARIAALFHIATNHKNLEKNLEIQKDSMFNAIMFTMDLQCHARKAFHLMSADPNFENAKYVLAWIKRTRPEQFTQRNCHHALQTRFEKVETLKAALKILEERSYIKYLGKENVPYRPSDPFLVNPSLFR